MICSFVDGSSRTMIWRVLSPFRKALYDSLSGVDTMAASIYKNMRKS